MKVAIVGGTYDHTEGKPSKLIDTIYERVVKRGHVVQCFNGGNVEALKHLFELAGEKDVVLWFPNVPNNYDSTLGVFKHANPKVFLVTSKRNDAGKYSFGELINRALGLKANLTVEFWKFGNRFQGRVFDPLGCVWACTEDFDELTDKLFERIEPLLELTRERSQCLGQETHKPVGGDLDEFYEIIKDRAETFHDLVHPADGVERFLGNTSFRCERGFPSCKHGGYIYVSRRNVDKRFIGPDAFVRVEMTDAGVGYYGDHKPSVDTPIQLRLYRFFPEVRYMLHSHVYIKGAPVTDYSIPCGAIEEFKEITAAFINEHNSAMTLETGNFSVNLLGHGSLVMADNLDYLRSVEYYARPVPEEL